MLIDSLVVVPVIRSVFSDFCGFDFGISEGCKEIWAGCVFSRVLLTRTREECRTLPVVMFDPWANVGRVVRFVRLAGPFLLVIEEFDLFRVSLEWRFAIK